MSLQLKYCYALATALVSAFCSACAAPPFGDLQGRGLKQPTVLMTMRQGSEITHLQFLPDARRVLACSIDPAIRLWDVASGKELRRFEGHSDSVHRVTVAPDGRTFVSGASDGTARLWDVETGKELYRFASLWHNHTPGVAFSPDGKMLAMTDYDMGGGYLRLWDLTTFKEVKRAQTTAYSNEVEKYREQQLPAFSRNGRLLATSVTPHEDPPPKREGGWLIWDIQTAQVLHTLPIDFGDPGSSIFCADDKQLLTSACSGLYLWDVQTGRRLKWVRTGFAYAVALSPNGRIIATGGFMNTTVLWDAATFKPITAFGGKLNPLAGAAVHGLCFSPDGRLLAVADYDDTIRVWSLSDLPATQPATQAGGGGGD